MAVPLRVGLTPDRADSQPGEALALQVSVRNTSDVVEHYGLDLLGLPENTDARIEPDVVKLRPGETGTAAVRIVLGTDPPASAGTYTVGVLVRSRYRDDISRCEELTVNVAVVQGIGIRVEPDVATGKRSAKYQVQVTNAGNVPVRLLLAATDPERRVKSRFNPPMVGLAPGGSARVGLAVRAPVPWNREFQRALKLEAAGDGAYGAAPATFLQRPRFASRLARVAGAVAALGVIAGAILGAAVIANNGQPPWADPTPVASAPGEQTPVGGPQANAGASAPTAPSAPSTAASAPGSAPPSSALPPGGPREVDLTKTGPGPVDSDTYRNDGLILGGSPDQGGDAACVDASDLAVVGADPNTRFLASSLRGQPDKCNAAPISIRFIPLASKVEFVFATPGDRSIEVNFKDLGRTTITGSAVADDGSHGGIDYVIVSGRATGQGAAPPPAIRSVKYSPLGG